MRVNQPDGQTGPLIGVPQEKAQIEEGWHDEVFGIEGRGKEVVLLWGSVEKRIMGEGLNFKVPIAETVIKVDVKVQPHPFKEIDASSKEYQMVKMTGMMNFHIDPAYVNEVKRLPLSNLTERKTMFDFDASCPHCDKKFKLNRIGLEAKEFVQCTHCRRIIKINLADLKQRQYG